VILARAGVAASLPRQQLRGALRELEVLRATAEPREVVSVGREDDNADCLAVNGTKSDGGHEGEEQAYFR